MHAKEAHDEVISPTAREAGHTPAVRLRGAVLVLCCGAVLATAWSMNPRAGGHGTHQELGLPACSSLARSGYPCPSCGMTTSVSAAARGRLGQAFSAQPFGVALVAAVVVFGWIGAMELFSGRSVVHRLRPSVWWVAWAVGGMLLGWAWKLAWGFGTGQYPLH